MRFSERKGIKPARIEIQRESMDDALRNRLWSALSLAVFQPIRDEYTWLGTDEFSVMMQIIWMDHFRKPVDSLPREWANVEGAIRSYFFAAEWYEVYDLLEAFATRLPKRRRDGYATLLNRFLEAEMSAYRLVAGEIAEITSGEEIEAIESAIAETETARPVHIHLRDALRFLTDRKQPNYRNSIKESISAVEAQCRLLTGDDNATLGAALKRLKDSGVTLHPALESAWSKLYGYTSDADGIRHSLTDEPTVSFADAKYMLVSCSAFVSYLRAVCT